MNLKKIFKFLLWTVVVIMVMWTALTIYVEQRGPAKHWGLGHPGGKLALIVFDPDPFYNLDEQVSLSVAKGLADAGMAVTVATVADAEQSLSKKFDLVVCCANTYNWRPDWAVTNYIRNKLPKDMPVVAITLGAGSTEASQKHLESAIHEAGGKLTLSYTLWLWRPNDETKLDQSNVDVANSIAAGWAREIIGKLSSSSFNKVTY